MHKVTVKDFRIGKGEPLTVIAGPCVIESEDLAMKTAEFLKRAFEKLPVNFIYKSSYDKANRSSINSWRGPGLEEGLRILEKVQREFDVPVVSDVHWLEEVAPAAQVLDVLQIPAFLCRQTDLVVACAETQKPLHIKKGQFMAPSDMKNVVEKVLSCNNRNILLADRGTSFGYNMLINDMRAIPIMQSFGFPVVFDSHSVQQPGGLGQISGGQREFIPTLAKASVAAGCNAVFIETHPEPEKAKSDSASVYPLGDLPKLIEQLVAIYKVVND